MLARVLPGFISREEAAALNRFTLDAVATNQFSCGRSSFNGNKHMVSRFNKELELPPIAFLIKRRIQTAFDLKDSDTNTMWNPSGIVVNCSFDGAEVVPHKDVRQGDKSLLRCNLLSSAAEKGGVLNVEGQDFHVGALDLYLCLVSEHTHSVSKVEGSTPRILWQFGFNVDKTTWEDLQTL